MNAKRMIMAFVCFAVLFPVVVHGQPRPKVLAPDTNPLTDFVQNLPLTGNPPFVHWDLREFPNNCQVPWVINPALATFPDVDGNGTAGQIADRTAANNAFAAAFGTWQAVMPSVIRFVNAAAAPATPGLALDGHNTLGFANAALDDNQVVPAANDVQFVAISDDVQMIAVGAAAAAGAVIVGPGPNGVLESAASPDDVVAGATIIEPLVGGNGTADSTAGTPVGPGAVIIVAGADNILATTPLGDEIVAVIGTTNVIREPLAGGDGIASTVANNLAAMAAGGICVNPGGNGVLDTQPAGDDIVVGVNIRDGGNGICETTANNQGPVGGALALTGLFFNNTNGVLTESDIVFRGNIAYRNFAHGAVPPAGQFDLQMIAMHEIGHFIGVAHPIDADDVQVIANDRQVIAPGGAAGPGAMVINSSLDGALQSTALVDDVVGMTAGGVLGIFEPLAGGNGVADSIANNLAVAAAGAVVVSPGADGFLVSVPSGDDVLCPGGICEPAVGGNGTADSFTNNSPVLLANPANNEIMRPFFSGNPVATNQMLAPMDAEACNFLYTPDLGDAPDPWAFPPVFNEYQSLVHNMGAGRMLNGIQLDAAALGPTHLFGQSIGDDVQSIGITLAAAAGAVVVAPGPNGVLESVPQGDDVLCAGGICEPAAGGNGTSDTSAVNYPFWFERLGPNMPPWGNPSGECESVQVDNDAWDDGVALPAPLVRGVINRVTVTITHTAQLGRYNAAAGARTQHLFFNGYFDFPDNCLFEFPADWYMWWEGTPAIPAGPGGMPAAVPCTTHNSLNFVPPAVCAANTITLNFDVPVPANAADFFYCRFRLDYGEDEGSVQNISGDLSFAVGSAQFGEVEDWPCTAKKPGKSIFPGLDLWKTPSSGGSYLDLSGTPIPPGFFDPGSDPFSSTIVLTGSPLDPPTLGQTDTIVERLAIADIPACGPDWPVTIPIQIRALSLATVNPVTVTYGGGAPEAWTCDVCLSDTPQPIGDMTIRQQCQSGGTYDSNLPVLPKLVFTRVGDGMVRTFDFGTEGILPKVFNASDCWVQTPIPSIPVLTVPPGLVIDGNCDAVGEVLAVGSSNFYPSIEPVNCFNCNIPSYQRPKLVIERSGLARHVVCPPLLGPICPCSGDMNSSGAIDFDDVFIFTSEILSPLPDPCADINGDGANNGGDIQLMIERVLNNDGSGTPCNTGPCPGEGECCVANFSSGCSEPACCNAVCLIDPACCSGDWDAHCAALAATVPACGCGLSTPCEDCGPGSDWVSTPPCPAGLDVLSSGALLGIDVNLDCVVDSNLILGGPVYVSRSEARDDSVEFPGSAPVDGILDVIDTEIVSMSLTGSGVTLTAGQGFGNIPLVNPSLGTIVQQTGNPTLADSNFNVFFEVDLGAGNTLYNQEPLVVSAVIDCVPPQTSYLHPPVCVPLYTLPNPGQGLHVANLVTAEHITFPLGACCLPGDICVDGITQGDCEQSLGVFQGPNTTCGEVVCGNTGACCLDPITCITTTALDCQNQGGVYQGDGVPCSPTLCLPTGACCLDPLTCIVTDQSDCKGQGGVYQGDGVTCGPTTCDIILIGACCLDPFTCVETDLADCSNQGGFYQGDGSTCFPGICSGVPVGACCVDPFTCIDPITQFDCEQGGGVYQGDSSTCAGVDCFSHPACPGTEECIFPHATPGCDDEDCCNAVCAIDSSCCDVQWGPQCVSLAKQVCGGGGPGACCMGTSCIEGPTQAECEGQGGIFLGVGQPCLPNICEPGDCCQVHPLPGCADQICEQCVCTFFPPCCTDSWDQNCVNLVMSPGCSGSCPTCLP